MIKMTDRKGDTNDQDLLSTNQKNNMSDRRDGEEEKDGWCSWFDWFRIKNNPYFDVTTDQIVSRVLSSLFPIPGQPLFDDGKTDLYGPFWIFITLNISMAVFGCFWVWIDHNYDIEQLESKMDIHKVSRSYTFLLFYFVMIPLGLFLLLKLIYPENPGYT